MSQLVLLRHGESHWNRTHRLTGWTDVDLTQHGESEAREAGRVLRSSGYDFDQVFTSFLRRSIKTAFLALEEMERLWLPVTRAWQLNERHYGSLTGSDSREFALRQRLLIEKGEPDEFIESPPTMPPGDPGDPANDDRYRDLDVSERPRAESLGHVLDRVSAYWTLHILPELRAGKRVLIVGHGSSLGLLVKFLGESNEELASIGFFPTGTPLSLELKSDLTLARRVWLRS
ncbi:MAG: 2,3-bisphosphoglycerate-dependent phosphoglycerate mutase [Planctomycetota bacterium]